jgi:2-succinyl-6-hydroxy-2,4-cyclohexadiene-1-carboxylate synthase
VKTVLSSFIEAGGARIHARIVSGGDPSLRPVVVLHGFTGSTESMRGVVAEICSARTTVSIDLLGHGCSDSPEDTALYSMESCVDQVERVIDALALDRPHLLGYSMGSRVALTFCTRYPERSASALVVGAHAGLVDPRARRERIEKDESLAQQILESGIEAFVDRWMALPLFASQARLGEVALAAAREQRLQNRPEGLARVLRGMGTGAMSPLVLSEIKVPLCFVAGLEDEKFTALARGYASRLESAQCEIVPGAGHAVHLEAPEMFGEIARRFHGRVDEK